MVSPKERNPGKSLASIDISGSPHGPKLPAADRKNSNKKIRKAHACLQYLQVNGYRYIYLYVHDNWKIYNFL